MNDKRAVQRRFAVDEDYRAQVMATNSKLEHYHKEALPAAMKQLEGGQWRALKSELRIVHMR